MSSRSRLFSAAPAVRAFRPGPLAGSGDTLWLLDAYEPLLFQLSPAAPPQLVALPAPPGPDPGDDSAPQPTLHADADGCWIAGPGGVFRVVADGEARCHTRSPVWRSAASGGVLAAAVPERGTPHHYPRLMLLRPNGQSDVRYVADLVVSLSPAAGGFLAAVADKQGWSRSQWDYRCGVVLIGLDGVSKRRWGWPASTCRPEHVVAVGIDAPA